MKAEEIELKAAQWLKEKGYDRRTWKNTSQLIAKFIIENNILSNTKDQAEEENFKNNFIECSCCGLPIPKGENCNVCGY